MLVHSFLARLLVFTALALLCFPVVAAAVVVRHDRATNLVLEKGKEFPGVGRFDDGSCTLVHPRWVLTAAHVARGLSPFSPTVRLGEKSYEVAHVVFHPEAKRRPGRPPRVDMALVYLKEPVEGVTPVALHDGSDEQGLECWVVGYGDFGKAGTPFTHTDDRRRAVSNIVERVESSRLMISFSSPPEGTELEGVGAPGDSGGPLLIRRGEKVHIIGVSSASMGGRPGQYGVRDVYARVSTARQWIEETLKTQPGSAESASVVRVASKGFPDTHQGRCVAEFLKALKGREELLAFAAKYRAQDMQARRPNEDWVEFIVRELGMVGKPVTGDRYVTRDGRFVLLVRVGEKGWKELIFHFQRREPHGLDGVGMRPGREPADAPSTRP